MSWPTWSGATAPIPTPMATPVQTPLVPSAINSAPAVVPPGLQYSPEQWAQMQQQNWQQWAQWQQQYQQWHQQYGAEYQKSISALQGLAAPQQPPLPSMPNTGVPPPLPVEAKPPLPPEEPPANQPTSIIPSYSTMPPKPAHAGYTTVPPPVVAPSMQMYSQSTDQYNSQNQTWQPNQQNLANKRPFHQSPEYEQNKRPLLERPKHWGNQKPDVNQWTNQPPPNMSYNQPPPQTQAIPKSQPNVEELSEAEKKFDKEFAAWEAQFNKWKEQNANHPDKTQYREYEKKWESWRNSLLERREQMRRKRLAMTSTGVGVNKSGNTTPGSTGHPPVVDSNRPPMDLNNPLADQNRLPGHTIGPGKLPIETPVRQQAAVADLVNNPIAVPINPPPPHQNNEPLSFKPKPSIDEPTGEFLKPSHPSGGGIPGLDLVKEDEGNDTHKEDIIELDKDSGKPAEPIPPKGPDFDAISKGINTILGDQKLLSMLSMVSQNPPSAPAPNVATNSVPSIATGYSAQHNFNAPPPHQYEIPPAGNFSAPPPTYQFREGPPPLLQRPNDHLHLNYDEKSHFGDNYNQRETVNNFDDQTRSSFTMAPNDSDTGYTTSNFSKSPFNNPINRFGGVLQESQQNNVRQHFGANAARPNPLGLGTTNRNRYGPNQVDTGPGNFSKNPTMFNQNDNLSRSDFNRNSNLPNDTFNRSINRQDSFQNDKFRQDSFQKDNFENDDFRQDKFNKDNNYRYGDNFSTDNKFRRNNFDDRRENFNNKFNKPGNYNEQQRFGNKGTYNRNQGDYDDYDNNFNEDDDYEKYHERFNDDEQDNDMPSYTQGHNQGKGPQLGQRQPPPRLMDLELPQAPQLAQRQPPARLLDLPQGPQLTQRQPPPRLMELPQVPPPEVVPDEEPIFEPTTVVDYDHKSLGTTEPDIVVEPIHMFDYRHKPMNRIPIPQRPKWLAEAVKFIREFDPLVSRAPLTFERPPIDRYPLNPRESHRDEWRSDGDDRYATRNRTSYEDRSHGRTERSFIKEDGFERETTENDDDKYSRRDRASRSRDGHFERDSKGNQHRLRDRLNEENFAEDISFDDIKQTDCKNFEDFSDDEMFEDIELKKHQQNREVRGKSKSPVLSNPPNPVNFTEIAMIEDIINAPGRFHRPPRIVIILRGPPGSGKTYLAKLIKDKEVENGGSAPRILSLDDYFMVEHEKEVIEDGKKIRVKEMVYEYEPEMEESYRTSFIKSFKKTITDGYFPFIIVDNINDKVKYFGEMWSFAKQNGFQVYICQLDLDPALCTKRNIHNRSEAEIEECIAGWEPTPSHHPTIDASGFLQSSIPDVEMEEVEEVKSQEPKIEEAPEDEVRSKWDTFDCSFHNLAKLDGISKPLRPSRTMEDYLQMENEWEAPKSTLPGQKRVRWADLEEQREQKKMRALGFIVGHTNWNRMMDPSNGSSALTHTKYI